MRSSNGSMPSGNQSSLVPEIRGMGGPSTPLVQPCKEYAAPKIIQSTILRNRSIIDLKDTGKS
jgi:hypothetical protein